MFFSLCLPQYFKAMQTTMIQDSIQSHFYEISNRLIDKHKKFVHKAISSFASVINIGENFLL